MSEGRMKGRQAKDQKKEERDPSVDERKIK